jgi:hypothetical protein
MSAAGEAQARRARRRTIAHAADKRKGTFIFSRDGGSHECGGAKPRPEGRVAARLRTRPTTQGKPSSLAVMEARMSAAGEAQARRARRRTIAHAADNRNGTFIFSRDGGRMSTAGEA